MHWSVRGPKNPFLDSLTDFDFGHFYFSKNVQNGKTAFEKGQKTCFTPCRCISQKKSFMT